MTETVWGFDLGTTSIGFAVVRQDPANKTGKIIKTGVRIFPEGITEKELEPRNQRRREKRMARRQIRRRRERRIELSRRFHDLGMLPRFGTDEWQELMKLDPYELRSEGMTICEIDPKDKASFGFINSFSYNLNRLINSFYI